jgi:hypothetical protein
MDLNTKNIRFPWISTMKYVELVLPSRPSPGALVLLEGWTTRRRTGHSSWDLRDSGCSDSFFWCIMVRIMVHICAYAPNLFMLDEPRSKKKQLYQTSHSRHNQGKPRAIKQLIWICPNPLPSLGSTAEVLERHVWCRPCHSGLGISMQRRVWGWLDHPRVVGRCKGKNPCERTMQKRLWSIRSMMHENTVSM